MDKVDRIKKIVETALDIHFDGKVNLQKVVLLPIRKFNESTNELIESSHTLLLIVKTNDHTLLEEIHCVDGFLGLSDRISVFLERLLGFEVCVDVL